MLRLILRNLMRTGPSSWHAKRRIQCRTGWIGHEYDRRGNV